VISRHRVWVLELPKYPRTLRYPGHSPTLEQLQRILAVVDSHERVIVLLLSTGGFREGTLCRLRYGNLKDDFESGIIPCLVRVEPQITKGQGWGSRGYWTFLPKETVEALKVSFDERRRGNRWFRPEQIGDNNPLVRNRSSGTKVRPITPSAIWQIIHALYVKAGIISPCSNQQAHQRKGPDCPECGYPNQSRRRQSLSVHSLRWFFRTQMTSLCVGSEYVEFWMGHVNPLYNDIHSKGEEFSRQLYPKADLTVIPKPKLTDRQIIEAFIRGRGLDPGTILREEVQTEGFGEPHRIETSAQEREQWELRTLTEELAESFFKEHRIPNLSSGHYGSPGEIRTPVDGSPP